MSDNSNNSIDKLIKVANQLLKRFEEQKGIIDSYVQRERDWKKNRILLTKEISVSMEILGLETKFLS